MFNTYSYCMEHSCSWKLRNSQPFKKFPAFHGTWSFITTFTSACHLSLSWARSIQSMPPHPTYWRSMLILSTHLCLGLPSGLFLSGFPTKTLYTPLLSPIQVTCSVHLILLDYLWQCLQAKISCWRGAFMLPPFRRPSKFTLEEAMKAQSGSRGIAVFFFDVILTVHRR